MTDNIKTNPNTGVRYYDEQGPREGRSVDLFVPVRNEVPTNPRGTNWPVLFGGAFDDPQLKFYLLTKPQVREYDSQMFTEQATWSAIDYQDPMPGGPAGTWEETLTVLPRPQEELLNQVEAYRLQANSRLYPSNEDPMLGVLLAEATRRDQEGTATSPMIELLQRHQALVESGIRNMERAAELRAQIKAGQPFDLSAGWANELPA